MSDTALAPFGSYFPTVFTAVPPELDRLYQRMRGAADEAQLADRAAALSRHLDENLTSIRKAIGGGDSRFSYFRGSFVEEVVLRLAHLTVSRYAPELDVETVKLSTGQGIIAGVSLEFSRDHVPEPVKIALRRDREDVTVGFRRTFVLQDDLGEGAALATFPNEIVPVCIIACKMYIDATRLENVTSKAKNLSVQHARCTYLVAAEWDALGREWHDARNLVVDSLYAPIKQMVFFRGDAARRPTSSKLVERSLLHPYQPSQIGRLASAIRQAIEEWRAKP